MKSSGGDMIIGRAVNQFVDLRRFQFGGVF